MDVVEDEKEVHRSSGNRKARSWVDTYVVSSMTNHRMLL